LHLQTQTHTVTTHTRERYPTPDGKRGKRDKRDREGEKARGGGCQTMDWRCHRETERTAGAGKERGEAKERGTWSETEGAREGAREREAQRHKDTGSLSNQSCVCLTKTVRSCVFCGSSPAAGGAGAASAIPPRPRSLSLPLLSLSLAVPLNAALLKSPSVC